MTGPRLAVTAAALREDRSETRLAERVRQELGGVRREEPAVGAVALCAQACLEQAGLSAGPLIAFVLAAGHAIEASNLAHARAVLASGPEPVNALTFIYTTPNAVAGRVSILLGLTGESLTVPDPAAPFWVAADLLAAGRAQAALVGGVSVRRAAGEGDLEGVAALLCLEHETLARQREAPVQGVLELAGTRWGAPAYPGDEASVAAALVRQFAAGGGTTVDCGRRGGLVLTPGPRRAAGKVAS